MALPRVQLASAAQPVNTNGKWKDTENWTDRTLPANAEIADGKKVTLDPGDAFSIQTLNIKINGNGLDGSGSLTLTGLGSQWLNGPLAGVGGLGELVITSTADLEMAGGPKTLTSWLLTNQGAITWTNGAFITGNGALVANSGTFTTTFDGTLSYNGTPARTIFTNSGTFSKTGGSGTTEIQATFNNSGNVTVSSGTVLFSGGGTSSGTVGLTTSGAKLRLATNNYAFTDGAVLNGPGTVEVAGAVTTFSGNITGNASLSITAGTATVNGNTSLGGAGSFTGGTLNGTGNLSLGGLLTLDGTTLSGAGIVNANGGASLVDSFSINASRTLNLAGSSTWSGGTIYGGGGSVVNVKSGATLANSADTTLSGTYYGSSGNLTTVLNIAGTLAKTAGASGGRTDVSAVVNNTGLIDVQAGTLDLSGGGTQSATAQIATGATLKLSGGTHNFNAGAAVTGSGTLHLSNGNLTVNDAVTSAAGGNFTGGTLNGAGTLTFTGPLTLAGATLTGSGTLIANGGAWLTSNFSINGTRTLTLGSNATWSAGNVYAGGGAVMNIQAGKVFSATADTFFYGGYWGGTTAVINNAGTFTRSTSSGTATVDAVFNNSGTLSVQTGTLDLGAGGTHTGTANVTSGATLALTGGNHTFQSGARIEGSGTVRVAGGNAVFTGNNTGTAHFAVAGGTATFEAATVTTGSGNFTGGTLTGSGTLTLGGPSVFAGTVFSGTGTLVSNGGATVSGSVYTQGGRTLTLGGTTAWTAGAFYAGNSTLNIPTGATFSTNFNGNIYGTHYGSGNLTTWLNIAGTFAKTAGAAGGRTDITALVNNTGLIDVQAGVLDLSNGGTHSAPAQVAAGAVLELSGGTHQFNAGAAVNGSGTLALSGGNLTVNAPVTSAVGGNFTGGTLNGSGNLTFTGPLTLAGTTLTGAGTLAANAGASISNYLHFNGTRTLALAGNSTWSDGYIYGGGSVLKVTPGAVLNVTGAGSLYGNYHGAATTVLDNQGTVTRSASSGTATIDAVFNNSGTLNVQTGTLDLGAGGTHTGTANVTSGATLALTGGTHTFQAGSSLTGNGTLRITGGNVSLNATVSAVGSGSFTGGNLTGPGNLTLSGPLTLAGTTLQGSGTITAGGGAAITSSFSIKDGQKLVLAGNSTWSAGTISHGSGAVLNNTGTLTHSFDGYLYHGYDPSNDATALVFNNSGTFTKSGGTGTTTFDANLVNTGTLNVQSGTLQLGHGGSSSGPVAVSANATLSVTDGFTVSNAAQVTGGGTLRLTGGTLSLTGQPGIATFTQTGGKLTGTQTFAQAVNWEGGDWNAAAIGSTTTIASGGTLNISNVGSFNYRSILNLAGGAVYWNSGYLRSGNGGAFTNHGTFYDRNLYGYSIDNPGSGSGFGGSFVFSNYGTYTRDVAGTTYIDTTFNNHGTLTLAAGDIRLRKDGTFSATSVVNAAADSELYFSGNYTILDGARFQGAGKFIHNDGTLDIAGALQASAFDWSGGNWNATAATLTTIAGGTTLTMSGSSKDFDYRSITVAPGGTVEWQSGYLRGGHGSVFTNEGTFRDKNAYGYSVVGGTVSGGLGGAFTFVNKGTYVRDVGGTTYFTAPFNNQGTVTLTNGGRIELDGGGAMAATSVVNAAGGTFVYFDSSYTLLSGAQLTGAGSFVQRGGTLTVDGTLKASSLTWSSGDWNAATAGLTTTLATGTTVTIAGSGNMDFNRRTIEIAFGGTLVWESGYLRSGNGGAIVNNGTFEDKNVSGYDILSPTASGGYGGTFTFTNAGTYKKTTAGTTHINIPFTNTGTLEIAAGSVVFGAALTNTGGITLANNATANFSAPLTVNQPLTGSGTITAPAVTATGQVAPGSSPGRLTLTGTLTLLGTSSLLIELGGAGQGTDYDFLSVGGTAAIAGDLRLSFLNGYQNSVPANATFTILSSAGLTGAFANVANGGTLFTSDGAGYFQVNYGLGSAFAQNSVVLSNFVAVPEPSTYALLALGLGFVIWQVRRWRA